VRCDRASVISRARERSKKGFFYNLNDQANRRAAPMLTNEKPYTGPSGSAQG